MEKARVLIVDDSAVMRRLIADALAEADAVQLAGTAENGRAALALIPSLRPDVVLLDVSMPEMDGVAALAEIRGLHPWLPVIFLSSTDREDVAGLRGLSDPFTDYAAKPSGVKNAAEARVLLRSALVPKIEQLCRKRTRARIPASPAAAGPRPQLLSKVEVVVVAVSTGGPVALTEVLTRWPGDFPVPILVVQHIPAEFAVKLAARLTELGKIPVAVAAPGTRAQAGRAWLAPGGFHLMVEKAPEGVVLRTNQGPEENSCRPSADVLFRSAAQVYGASVLAVVLTGMGTDGLRGCERIRAAGGQVLVQDESSSVVWGMPGMVANAGLADKIVRIEEMAEEVLWRVLRGRKE